MCLCSGVTHWSNLPEDHAWRHPKAPEGLTAMSEDHSGVSSQGLCPFYLRVAETMWCISIAGAFPSVLAMPRHALTCVQ